ncbi:hypothetical protein HaLaN_28468, partial [Haematococcus lacustris]
MVAVGATVSEAHALNSAATHRNKSGMFLLTANPAGHPRHWPRNSLFGTVFDPLHVILPPLGSTSHNGVASRRGGMVAGGISVPSSLCCRWTGQLANTSQVLGCFEDQHQTHTSPRLFQAAVQPGYQLLKTVSK